MTFTTTRPFANIPGVIYPSAPPTPRAYLGLPKNCPPRVATLPALAPWIHAAGLWASPPSKRTLQRWKSRGLIITVRGPGKRPLIDVPATLKALSK